MVIHAIENFVLFSTLCALAGFLMACAVRYLTMLRLVQLTPYSLTRIYTALIVFPPGFSAWLTVAAFLPEAIMGKVGFEAAHLSPQHEFHLISETTARLEPALAYITILFLCVIALFAIYSTARGYLRIGGMVKKLDLDAAQPSPSKLVLVRKVAARYGLEVGLVMSEYPFSFVWGFSRSKLLLSSGLLCSLSQQELAGVLEHESAHHSRRDNLAKLFLNFCCHASFVFPLSRLILKWRAIEVEMICDEIAVSRTSAPLEIAEALIKLRRQSIKQITTAPLRTSISRFVPDDTPTFERRVRRLIDFTEMMPSHNQVAVMSGMRKSRILSAVAVFTLTLLVATLCTPLAVHHAAEAFIHIIK